jgi:hypothetical protein
MRNLNQCFGKPVTMFIPSRLVGTLIEMVHANTEAVFDLVHEIASAEAPSDHISLLDAAMLCCVE